MSGRSGFGRVLGLAVAVLLVWGVAQYVVLLVKLQAAQSNFSRMTTVYRTAGEAEFRKSVVEALRAEGFHHVEPGDIAIEAGGGSGTAKFRLEVTHERNILWFPVRKSAVLYAEAFYDRAL